MWLFWAFAFVPIIAGLIMVFLDRKVAWQEWLISTIVAFLMAGLFQLCATIGMTHDIETWSGQVSKVEHHPQWVEQWIETHSESYPCGTDKDGSTTYCTRYWTTTEYDTHSEHWEATLDFGKDNYNINIAEGLYNEIKHQLGDRIIDGGTQSYHHFGVHWSGDNNIYATPNDTHFIRPVTQTKSFVNKIKAAPSLFSYSKVPTNVAVFTWPETTEIFQSDRVMGTAKRCIDTFKWDQMNASLGATKKVNLIIVGFGNQSEEMAHYQEAKWIGGKKNDLVICYGGGSLIEPAQWVKVFGWTEKEIVKQELCSLLLENPINNELLPQIAETVRRDYIIKDWKKFDYITIEPPAWSYWVYFIVVILVQGCLYVWFHLNDLDSGEGRWGQTWMDRLMKSRGW